MSLGRSRSCSNSGGSMRRLIIPAMAAASFASVAAVPPAAQTSRVTGDRSTPHRRVAGDGHVGISNAVLRDQAEVRALRVVVEPGGTRAMHTHENIKFHLFVPITGPMRLNLD